MGRHSGAIIGWTGALLFSGLLSCDTTGAGDECSSFSGTACERVVQCCDFAQGSNPTGPAAKACLLKRPVAAQAAASADPSDDAQCLNMTQDPALAECELQCTPAGTATAALTEAPTAPHR